MTLFLMLALAVFHAARPTPAAKTLGCTYASRPDKDILSFKRCAWRDRAGRLYIGSRHLRRLDYDRFGLAPMFIDKWYYVRRDGRFAPTMPGDNWAEDFVDGRARSPVNGKIGFIDRSLALRINAKYDGAYPFQNGFAVVCLGCKSRSVFSKVDGDLLARLYVGGAWACIDRSGHLRSAFRALKPKEDADALCPKRR